MSYFLHRQFIEPKHSQSIYIFFHGFGSSSCLNEFDETKPSIIDSLQKFDKNCGILTFDFVGHGKSTSTKEQDILKLSPAEEITNIKKIFELVHNTHPHSKIIPICASHGALILSLFLDKNPYFLQNITKIIAWYPCLQYLNIFYTKHNSTIKPLIPGSSELSIKMQEVFEQKKVFTPWENFSLSSNFYKNIEKYTSAFFENTSIPTLILHGEDDKIVSFSYSENIAEKNKNITLKCIKNASHSFEEFDAKKEVVGKCLEFLKK